MTGGQGVGDRREGGEPVAKEAKGKREGKAEVQGEVTLHRTHRLLRLAKREGGGRGEREGRATRKHEVTSVL